ncbi:MAG: ABC transporter permease [Hyphomonas sp. BRH_c22]|uniref:FecCD family ABC transporter permease n=1 Tax=Hyphomonas sp. BRH_c22 TaxID=1629710 RepID=UPI0005F14676|nr:iron ABC transporter permease [Hyphomonas sp. BRH_c22]KJS35848.1 MAG: ABC transporter permease [Hyphomonas sp. BRH_c22]
MKHVSLILAAGCVVLLSLSVLVGSAPLGLGETFAALIGQGTEASRLIVWEIRLPRAVAAFGVGAALGLSGAGLQGLLQNPLAGPGVLGVSAFASLGAVIAIYFGLAAAGSFAVPLAAILFSGLAVALLLFAAGRGASTVTLLLVGIGLSSLAGALMSLALNLAPNPYSLSDLINWMLGSVANRSWTDVGMAVPAWALGAAAVLMAGPSLRALSLGEETAASLGVSPARVRLLIIVGTSLLAGASVALAGTIGFVGMVAPHIVRPLVKHDPQRVLLPSALAAGGMLLGADMLVRVLPFSQELKLGVAAALFGAPVFIWIAARLGGSTR